METVYTLQFTFLLVGTAVALVLAFRAWLRRPAPGSIPFAVHMLAVSLWAMAYGLELTSVALDGKLVWANFKYLAQIALPVAWLWFVREYTGRTARPPRRMLLALSILPLTTLIVLFTSPWHGFFWQTVSLAGVPPFIYLQPVYGPWYGVHVTFTYLCLLIGSVQLVRHWQQVNYFFRWQIVTLVAGLLLPWAGNLLHVAGLTPLDLTPLAFALSGLLLMRFALRYRLFDISPVAHRLVMPPHAIAFGPRGTALASRLRAARNWVMGRG